MRKLVLGIVAGLAWTGAAAAADVTGEWLVDGGYARVRIENCSGKMWGVVAWEKVPGNLDKNNPDASKRSRPTLGIPIMISMVPSSEPNRYDGEIYNTEDGRTYTAHISLKSPDVLRVEGCVLGILCGGQDWTRHKGPVTAAATGPKAIVGPGAQGVGNAGRESTQALCTRVAAMAGKPPTAGH